MLLVGDPQSGKKHLFNQSLIKLYRKWNKKEMTNP